MYTKKTSIMGIREFYNGCDIFITGGSGFMGKVLVEKLLRSCPGIDRIYLLMRHDKQKDIHLRVQEMLKSPLFEKINKENPGMAEKKLIPVFGNLMEIKLGLSDEDYNMLTKNVSIVFHVAATTRFDEPFRDAILKNVRGTREVVRLAKQMETLKVFLHVSTTYCNCNRINTDEKIYESLISWQDAISIAENMDPKISNICTTQFLGPFPNTYTLSKLIAEQIINEETTQIESDNNMPMVVFRPSIVISTIEEPIAGWTNGVTGPFALMIAVGKGVAQVTLGNKNGSSDFMPVDLSIKAMIVAAFHRGTNNLSSEKKIHVYNSSTVRDMKNTSLLKYALKYFTEFPFDEILWRPRIYLTSYKWLFFILTIIQQVIPAIFITSILNATGVKSSVNLVRLQQKIYLITMALSYFSLQTWTFNNSKFLGLLKCIPDSEKQDFDFAFDHFGEEFVFKTVLIGTQKYLFQNDSKTFKESTKKLKRLIWLDRFLITVMSVLVSWYLFKFISFLKK